MLYWGMRIGDWGLGIGDLDFGVNFEVLEGNFTFEEGLSDHGAVAAECL